MSMPPSPQNGLPPEPDFNRRVHIAKVRHQLRTPLNAIIGYSEMLREDAAQSEQHDIAAELGKIRAAGKEILLIINDILRLSETRSKPIAPAVKDLGTKLSFALRTPLTSVIGYSEMLMETCSGSEICHFESDLRKIHSAAVDFYATIKDIANLSDIDADAIAGTIDVDVQGPDIDAFIADAGRRFAADTAPQSVVRHSLLVVDDSQMTRDLLSRLLARHGNAVDLAGDGKQAMQMLRVRRYDLVLLDILMPEMNGYQVLERIKADPGLDHIPVIMISALDDLKSVVKCIEIGADDYLLKPINPVLLTARINNCLERKRLRELEKEQKLACTETFGIYVDHNVRDAVLTGSVPLDGELRDVSVLFADLRGFSALAESLPPKTVVNILNNYFTEMAPAIHRHHGTILQYVGDEIYAVFGAPLSLADHSRQALGAALEMRQRLQDLNHKLEAQGHAELEHGIGIHSGTAVAANVGTEDRMAYNLVGDTVNLASRIQGLTREHDCDIIISADTASCLDDAIPTAALPLTRVKGRQEPVALFRIL
jgi:class 3 adenylate cyclase